MAAQAGTELFSIQLNGAICYENRSDFPIRYDRCRPFMVIQMEQLNLQKISYSLWRENGNNIR
jgi:hypothetical protein